VVVVDSDLEGSCGLKTIRETYPEVFIKSGIMERANFSLCAGFSCGDDEDNRQGIFATFAAFQEMLLSEITMARLNFSNVLCHFSHSGCDEMADNQCHFGVNNLFADCSLENEHGPKMQLFFPADVHQLDKVVDRVFWEKGLRFIYTSRSKVPELLDEEGTPYFGKDYTFEVGRDDFLHGADEQCAGYVVSFGDALYRSLDAVRRLRKQGLNVGLLNKCHVNVVDEHALQRIGRSDFVLCVESQNTKTGLGIRLGTWLMERGLHPKFARCGTHREGCGGIWEHAYHQGFDSESIMAKVRHLADGAAEKAAIIKQKEQFASCAVNAQPFIGESAAAASTTDDLPSVAASEADSSSDEAFSD
jgi:transketolase C-terminal domain/subunit